jgi:hypothetical protein
MSRMQEALSRKDYDCAKPAVPVLVPCETDTQERSDMSFHDSTLVESDYRQHRRRSTLTVVGNHPTRGDRPAPPKTSQLKSPGIGRENAPRKCKLSKRRSVHTHRHGAVSGQSLQLQSESVQAQMLRFQARVDLRECLLPGMLSRISPKACKGWQHQASLRNSRMMAKMKLEICKSCRFGLQPEPTSV